MRAHVLLANGWQNYAKLHYVLEVYTERDIVNNDGRNIVYKKSPWTCNINIRSEWRILSGYTQLALKTMLTCTLCEI